MMKTNRLFHVSSLVIVSLLTGINLAAAFDELPRPPESAGLTVAPPQTEQTVTAAVTKQLRGRFAKAAGGEGRLLSQAQAKAAGWGFVSDNFSSIDRDKDGFIKFDDLQLFAAARSPQKLMQARKMQQQQKQTIQKIE